VKRRGNLFRQIVALENLQLAHRNARRGKAHYAAVQEVNANEDVLLRELQWLLVAKMFRTASYRTRTIYEPKKRLIYILPYYPDRIVQHAAMNILQPIWDALFIYDSYSGIPGKGIHAAMERLSGFLEDAENTCYCLQFDIKSYYPSVDHEILLALITHKIKCRDTLWLLEDVIRSVASGKGIPIGNYLSQYFANVYLDRFDHWLKEDLHVKYYMRYNDDGVILHSNKEYLHNLWARIAEYLEKELHLSLNSRTQVYSVGARGIDFLGYRTFRDHKLMRKRSATRFKRRVREAARQDGAQEPQAVVSSVMSYVGWLQHCNCYGLLRKYLLDNVQMMAQMDMYCAELNFANPLRRMYATV